MRNKCAKVGTLLITLILFCVPHVGTAQEFTDLLEKGTREYGISTGYGWSFNSTEEVNTVPLTVHGGRSSPAERDQPGIRAAGRYW